MIPNQEPRCGSLQVFVQDAIQTSGLVDVAFDAVLDLFGSIPTDETSGSVGCDVVRGLPSGKVNASNTPHEVVGLSLHGPKACILKE